MLVRAFKVEIFELRKPESVGPYGFYNGDENTYLVFENTLVRIYHFKRNEPIPENYYPDFVMTVFEFESESNAKKNFLKIQSA